MIFFVANDGTVINSVPSPVYQGSANANDIYLVAPFAEDLQASVAFKLPNGVWTVRYPMTTSGVIEGVINKETGKPYLGWQFTMPNDITRYYGTVTAQFFFHAAQGKVVVATSSTNFTVGRGVPTVLPDAPSDDVYELIQENLSALQSQLDNGAFAARAVYAWNPTYSYGANEITYYPDIGLYGAFVKSKAADNLNHPPYNEDGELNSQYWEIVYDFNTIKGDQGDPGEAATITVGKVTTGAPGSQAEVINAGTEQNAIFDITIPAGKQGPKGDQGDPGIGNATLSNTDGDSTEDGFTQAAVKGIAQAKNYYNLGAFDTFVSNGDGTGTTTRKTITKRLLSVTVKVGFGFRTASPDPTASTPPNASTKGNIVSNFGESKSWNQIIEGQKGISLTYAGTFAIGFGTESSINSVEDANKYLNEHPVWIQYEAIEPYQNTEQVIENQPIRPANREEEQYWHKEWQKGLNLLNDMTIRMSSGMNVLKQDGGDLEVKITDGDPWFRSAAFENLPVGTYTLSCNVGIVNVWQTINGVITKKQTFTVPQTGQTDIHIEFERLTAGVTYHIYLMLVSGTNSYPYERYYGKIIHQKDLSGIQLFPANVNPAQTIGGDWEDKGTVTTSDNTVFHAYKRLS